MLSRTGQRILDHNLASLIRMDGSTPSILDELVLDFHEYPQLVVEQIVGHRYFRDFFYGILKIMDVHTPKFPGVAGNAAYVLGALLDSDLSRSKVVELLKDESRCVETQHSLPNLAALIETYDLEAMTNASGTASLIFECEESRDWALDQPSCEWLIYILSRALLDTDMWVASNCALTLARICMCEKGKEVTATHKEAEFVMSQLIISTGVDNEGRYMRPSANRDAIFSNNTNINGRGMNAAFAIAYLCEEEENMKKIAGMKEMPDLIMGLINMLRSVDEGCRKNALFCLKTMSKHAEGRDALNADPDIETLLKQLNASLTCGDEDLGKMAAVTLKNLCETKEGYMIQKDKSTAKTTLQHVLTNMTISEELRAAAFEAMKNCMIPKPEPPTLRVKDAYNIIATWEPVEAKSGNEVLYELFCGDDVCYTGNELTFNKDGLKERTNYEFRVRAFTEDEEESFVSDGTVAKTFRAVSSPPIDLHAKVVTSCRIQLVWKRPSKFYGTLKHYLVKEKSASLQFEPTMPYQVVSNLEPNKEYTFEVCAVTQRGKGEIAALPIKTLKRNDKAPSNIKLVANGPHEIAISWDKPKHPPARINGYEVLCNEKAIFFGTATRCVASGLHQDSKYKFMVVAWTSDGRNDSETFYKKTSPSYKKQQKPKNLDAWLENKEDLAELENDEEEEEAEPEAEVEADASQENNEEEQDDTNENEEEEEVDDENNNNEENENSVEDEGEDGGDEPQDVNDDNNEEEVDNEKESQLEEEEEVGIDKINTARSAKEEDPSVETDLPVIKKKTPREEKQSQKKKKKDRSK